MKRTYLPFYVASLEKYVCLLKFIVNFDGTDAEKKKLNIYISMFILYLVLEPHCKIKTLA